MEENYMSLPPAPKEEPAKKVPRTWLSKAFLTEIEPKTYGLFRSLMTMEYNPRLCKELPVKVKDIGPIRVLRRAEKGEEDKVVLKTVDPKTAEELCLVELNG